MEVLHELVTIFAHYIERELSNKSNTKQLVINIFKAHDKICITPDSVSGPRVVLREA